MSIKTKILKYGLLPLLVLLLVMGIYHMLVPFDITQTKYKDRFISQGELYTEGKVDVGVISLKLLPRPRITVKRLQIDADYITLYAEHTDIYISLSSIFRREIVVSSLSINKPNISLVKRANTLAAINKFIRGVNNIYLPKIRINNGYIKFYSTIQGSKAQYDASGVDLSFSPRGNNLYYNIKANLLSSSPLSISGEITGVGQDAQLEGRLKVKALDTNHLLPYLKTILKDTTIKTVSDIDAKFIYKGDTVQLNGGVTYTSLNISTPIIASKFTKSPSGSFHIDLQKTHDSTRLKLSGLSVDFDDFSIKGDFEFSELQGAKRLMMDVSSSSIPVDVIIEYLPFNLLPIKAQAMVNDLSLQKGNIKINKLLLSGTTEELSDLEYYQRQGVLTMELALDEIDLTYKGLNRDISDLSGDIGWRNGALFMKDIQAIYGKNLIERITGNLNADRYKISVDATLDAEETLIEINDWVAEDKVDQLKKMRPYGSLILKAEIEGQSWTTMPVYKGEMELKDISIIHDSYPLPLTLKSGRLLFDQLTFTLDEVQGYLGKTAILVKGTINGYRGDNPSPNLDFSGKLTQDAITTVFKDLPLQKLSLDGEIDFSGSMKEAEGKTSIMISIYTTSTGISYPPFIKKRKGFPASAKLSILSENGKVDIEEALIELGRSTVKITGNITNNNRYTLQLAADELMVDDMAGIISYIDEGQPAQGKISMHLKLRDDAGGFPEIEGEAKILNVGFSSGILTENITSFDASVKFMGNTAKAVIEGMQVGESDISGAVKVVDLQNAVIDFNLASSYMNLDKICTVLIKKGKKREGVFPPVTGKGRLTIKRGIALGSKIESFQATINMDTQKISMAPFFTKKYGGSVVGNVEYHRQNVPQLFTIRMKLLDVDIEPLLQEYGVKKRILSSSTINATLELTGKRWITPVRRGMNGRFNILSKDGKLWKFALTSKLFSIINIISINDLLEKGLPYKTLEGDFLIKDGIITTENLFLNSNSMSMSTVAEINTSKWIVDAKLAVHPFVTVDKVITTIPIAGWIIGGKEKSIVNIYYEIKGPFKDPKVKFLPVKSIGGKLFSIFQRLLVTPVKPKKPDTQ